MTLFTPARRPTAHALWLAALSLAALAVPAAAQNAPDGHGAEAELSAAAASRTKGAEAAPVTILEIADFQCPFCRDFAVGTLAKLDSAYVQTGKVRMVYFNYPLPSHPQAWAAAEAALCAGAQGAFWPMHDRLYEEQQVWARSETPTEQFERYAGDLGLDVNAYRTCTVNDRVAAVLLDDVMQVARSGVSGTPTFILSRAGAPQSQRALSGAASFEQFQAQIEELLAEAN